MLAAFATLAALAFPGMRDTAMRKQVKEGLALADLARQAVQAAWTARKASA